MRSVVPGPVESPSLSVEGRHRKLLEQGQEEHMEERMVQPDQFKYTDNVPNGTLFPI